MEKLKIKNHYVPKVYLKQWATGNKLYEYRLLVSHEKVPKWNKVSISNTATVNYLYLYLDDGELNDEMENYFSEEFEMRYGSLIEKVNSYEFLNSVDFEYISKLVVGQFIRTLSGYYWSQSIIQKTFPEIVEELSRKIDKELTMKGSLPKREVGKIDKLLPLKLEMLEDEEKNNFLKVETYAGKSSWLMCMKHLLGTTYKSLITVSWRIYDAPNNFYWTTSDDPVILLNYYGKDDYDFNGGFGNIGTEIIFPLSPNKLLYTKIGDEFEEFYVKASYSTANLFQKIIVEHAFSKVYSLEKSKIVTKMRKRIVDETKYRSVDQSLKDFHENYINKEVPYLIENKDL
ncbi:DUF4238 domain-containing protein [Enterococcus plantarum]|uniref:DUF4238 domain-containing protein n=1 Tax=Enterococcus plantarum TaxID=1077675 RepID=UPI001A8E5C80|nr:DUF4238 domain-containing protein [Enterococcus plantarum]MBO0466844.1 DUF4238 domain-containing protein [Enterococcus plantarum]